LDPTGVPIPGYHQGRSLLPVLEGKGEGTRVRESVRCEYFDALDPYFTGGDGSFGTMYRTERYKLSIYHDKNLGELYDLELDPWEFENLWDDAEYAVLKNRLILESFNSHVNLTTDVGSKRIAPM
jgi:arylsulfatase A-like enzyme